MKKIILVTVLILFSAFTLFSQEENQESNNYLNSADLMLIKDNKLGIGGYGEVHFNQPISNETKHLGTLDVHRIIMFLGYNFSEKTKFVSEIEFEHTNELWVEQAFLQHKINKYISFRAGLLLIPMGITNEYHEPTTFFSVERPIIDSKIAPSTWREIGLGFSGNIIELDLKYQIYTVGGLNGYDTKGVFNGANGIRNGRQKGAKTYVSSPNFTGRIEYYGINNLNIGLSGYLGNSQSKLYNKIDRENTAEIMAADSSVVGIAMTGLDFRYQNGGFELNGQFYLASFSNTDQYNEFTSTNGVANDLAQKMYGYYIELGYNVFRFNENLNSELIPYLRFEHYDTHFIVSDNVVQNLSYDNQIISLGLNYKFPQNVVLKTEFQLGKSQAENEFAKVFNAGFGYMF